MGENKHTPAEDLDRLVERARSAIGLGQMCGVASTRPANIYQVAIDLLAQVEAAAALSKVTTPDTTGGEAC